MERTAIESLPSKFYTPFLSDLAKERKPSPSELHPFLHSIDMKFQPFYNTVRGLYPLESRPGLISLLAGKPNSSTFPLTSLQFKSRSPTNPSEENTTEVSGKELAEGLQYGPTAGIPSLCEWVYGLQEKVHGRHKGEGWRVSIGSGSQDVIYKVSSIP